MYIRGFAYIYRDSFSVVLFGISFLVNVSKRLATVSLKSPVARRILMKRVCLLIFGLPTELIFLYRGSKLRTFENQNRTIWFFFFVSTTSAWNGLSEILKFTKSRARAYFLCGSWVCIAQKLLKLVICVLTSEMYF